MQRASSSVLGALLLAVMPIAAAAEDSAPLEATKKELQQLQSAQKTKPGATGGESLKLDTPTLDVPSATLGASEQWLAKKNKQDRKREQQKKDAENWLVNGVDKLGRENAQGNGKAPTAADQDAKESSDATAADAAIDSSDPQYLLKLFDDQKKQPAGKQADAKPHATPGPDPFAPFLQNWLSSSPVREPVLSQFSKSSDAGGGAPMPASVADYRPASATPVSVATGREAPGADKPNPYLIELNTPLPAKDLSAGAGIAPIVDASVLAPEASKAPATIAPLDPLPDARTPAKGPPPGPADDKKYFPQLKKF